MKLNFLKKPLGLALFLFIGAQIAHLTRSPIPLTISPYRLFPFLVFILVSYLYTRFFKFQFSPKFIFKSCIWHFILCFILPASLLLATTASKHVLMFYAAFFCGFSDAVGDIILMITATLASKYLMLFICCLLGNCIAMRQITKNKQPIAFFKNPILFAGLFVFILIILNSALPSSLTYYDNVGNVANCFRMSSSLVLLLIIKNVQNISSTSLLLVFLMVSSFVMAFSFVYTWFYQSVMSMKFKILAIVEIIALIFLVEIAPFIIDSVLRSYLIDSINSFTRTEFIHVMAEQLLSFTNLIIVIAAYIVITLGNRLAVWYLQRKHLIKKDLSA